MSNKSFVSGSWSVLTSLLVASVSACAEDTPREVEIPVDTPVTAPGETADRTWDLCRLVGPDNMVNGLYGTDLGFTTSSPGDPQRLNMLFGDTWGKVEDVCAYPVADSDDMQATLPARRPSALRAGTPSNGSAACTDLKYTLDNPTDPSSWRRMHLYPDAAPRSDERRFDMSMLRTPVATFSDGAHAFGIFIRHVPATCASALECPADMACSSDPASYTGKPLGSCQPQVNVVADSPPTLCLEDKPCALPQLCTPLPTGVCVAKAPFTTVRDGRPFTPDWYASDPRRAVAGQLYIASAFWPDRPEDYATGYRFITNKFTNAVAKTVANFDPSDPSKNDYRPGNHTLLMWGRPGSVGGSGFQPLLFLLAQPLQGLLDAQGAIHFQPSFFAGYDANGLPRWSPSEADAQPVYNADADLERRPEFDYVNQMAMSWVEPMQRWVMFYSGSVPAWLAADRATGQVQPPSVKQPSEGAIYLRSAAHPWGRATADAPANEAWSDARPVLTRQRAARYLACDDDAAEPRSDCMGKPDPNRPSDLTSVLGELFSQGDLAATADATAKCLVGGAALGAQYSLGDDSAGHLYGSNIIDSWTADVTRETPGLANGEQAVEVYWNVSTWNPYQVVMMKTQLRGGTGDVY